MAPPCVVASCLACATWPREELSRVRVWSSSLPRALPVGPAAAAPASCRSFDGIFGVLVAEHLKPNNYKQNWAQDQGQAADESDMKVWLIDCVEAFQRQHLEPEQERKRKQQADAAAATTQAARAGRQGAAGPKNAFEEGDLVWAFCEHLARARALDPAPPLLAKTSALSSV